MGEVGQPVFCILYLKLYLYLDFEFAIQVEVGEVVQPVNARHSFQRLRDEENPVRLFLLELHFQVEMPPERGKGAKSVKSSANPRHPVQVSMAQMLQDLQKNLRWQVHQVHCHRLKRPFSLLLCRQELRFLLHLSCFF